jgi:hypothetical protein
VFFAHFAPKNFLSSASLQAGFLHEKTAVSFQLYGFDERKHRAILRLAIRYNSSQILAFRASRPLCAFRSLASRLRVPYLRPDLLLYYIKLPSRSNQYLILAMSFTNQTNQDSLDSLWSIKLL